MTKPKLLPLDTVHMVRDTCLCLHTQRAARALARRFDNALKPVGLTNGQFSLMMGLNRPDPPNVGQVAALLTMDRTTLTAALKALERRGLITVTPDPSDRRGRRLALTGEGLEALRAALPIWLAEHAKLDKILAGIGPDSARTVLRALG
jgi:DNA-binding MarR family transcriptional regulator